MGMEKDRRTPTVDELMEQMAALSAQVESLADENARLARENARCLGELDRLLEQIKLMNTRYYGSKSEKVVPEQLSLFNAVEADADDSVGEPSADEAILQDPTPRRRGGRRRLDFEGMETVIVEHRMPEPARECPQCGGGLADMKVEVTKTVRLVPAHLVVEEHRREVLCCKHCNSQNAEDGSVGSVIVRAPMPKMPIPHSFATPSLLSYVINAKYTNATPLYRLEEDFGYLGADISRQNMANWILNVHRRWLSLLYARMKEKLLGHDILHCDETGVQVLKEPGRAPTSTSYMWLFRTAAVDTPICIYEYHPTRAGKVVAHFLKGWGGTITTDGYDPYFNLGPAVTNTACLVHVRRKFAQIVKTAGGDVKAAKAGSVALEARRKLDEIFHIDSAFDAMEPETRKAARLKTLAPKMAGFESWARIQRDKAVPRMELHKALSYALKYWPYVTNVLDDGRLELSNNIAERAIKPFVIGRKNWLFSNTPRGADASAAIYSIVVTAKLNGLKPRDYIEWLLTEMPNTEDLQGDAIDRFLPWSADVPESCRMTPEKAAEATDMPDDPIMDIDPEAFDED